MKFNKKYFLFPIIIILLNGCSANEDVKIIRLAHALSTTTPVHKGMVFMSERLDEISKGKLKIEIYPSQELGTERENLELLQIGSLGMTKVSSSVLEKFDPAFQVFSLPYVFNSNEHRYKVLEGEIGKEMLKNTEQFYFVGLCFYDAGSRSFYTKEKPILTPSDLAGMKIRVQESTTSIDMIRALGGSATPIAWGELYTALQQGVVDGAENNAPSFYLSRHYEVCKYFSLDEHTSVPDVLLISTEIWNELTEQEKIWVQQAADESAIYQKELWAVDTKHALEEVQKAGVEVFYPDKSLFEAQVQSLIEEYRKNPLVNNLLNKINSVK